MKFKICLWAALVLAAAAMSARAQILIDDFSSLGTSAWTSFDMPANYGYGASTFDASSGALTITTPSLPAQNNFFPAGIRFTPSITDTRYVQGTWRTKVRLLNVNSNAAIAVRAAGSANLTRSYSFFIQGISNIVGISRADANPNGSHPTYTTLAYGVYAINPNVDYILEAKAVGSSLSLRFWVDGTTPPASPQINAVDATYSDGAAGVFAYNEPPFNGGGAGVVSATFDDIYFTFPKPTAAKATLPNGSILIGNGNLVPGREYWNVFSVEPAPGGVGTGPYGGLWASDVNSLINQVIMPVGAEPFHYIPTNVGRTFGPYSLPAGIVFEMVVLDLYAIDLDAISTVLHVVI